MPRRVIRDPAAEGDARGGLELELRLEALPVHERGAQARHNPRAQLRGEGRLGLAHVLGEHVQLVAQPAPHQQVPRPDTADDGTGGD
jgi:hypothetical protein